MSKDDDTEQFLRPSSNDNGPSSDNKDIQEAERLLDVIKSNEKPIKDIEEQDENIQDTKKASINPTGRPKNLPGERGRILCQLKKIWKNKNNKASEICSAASLYADLMGYKQKTSDSLGNKEILKIIFDVARPPANKMISEITTKVCQENSNITTATTTPPETAQLEGPLDDANKKLDELADFEDVSLLDGPVTTVDDKASE